MEKYDDDFPIRFCPVCGGNDIGTSGSTNRLINKESWDLFCSNCKWNFEIFLLKKGRKVFMFRKDYKEDEDAH